MHTGSGRAKGNLLTNNKGSILIEFAMVITIMLIIFMGSVTLFLLFSDYYGAQKVAAEVTREIFVTGSEDRGRAKAYEAAWLWGLDPNRLTVDIQKGYLAGREVNYCTVRYTARPFYRTFPTLVGQSPLSDVQITAQAVYGAKNFTD